MGHFLEQNPGIGGIDELTDAEELFIQNLAGLAYAAGDILYHDGSNLNRLAKGTDTNVLTLASGLPSWAAGGGDVSKVGTPVDGQIGVWTGDGTIEGDSALTFDTSTDSLVIAASGNLLFGAVSILDDTTGTMTLQNIDALDATTESTIEAAIDTLGAITINATTEPALTISMTNISGTDNQAIDIVGGEALGAAEHWTGIRVRPNDLDPTGADTRVRGMAINLSGVDTTQGFEAFAALRLVMPSAYDINTCALDIQDGKICHNYTTGSDAGATYTAYDSIVDASNLNANSEFHALDVAVAGGTPSGAVVALGTHSNVSPIHQHIGSFSTPSQTEYAGRKTGGGATWADGVDTIEVFIANSDEVYLGAVATFSEIEVIMTTPGTKTVSPTFWYNTAADSWTQFYPADDTNGFKQSGTIRWDSGDISGWTNDGDPGAGDSSAGYWIKIVRTANPDPGTPTPTTMKTGTVTEYYWDKDGDMSVKGVLLAGDLGVTGTRVTKGWFTDLECTNSMAGSITGTATNLSGTPALPNGTTATTQSASDNSTKLATTAYADTAAAGGGASAALDNLASVAINLSLVSDTYNTDDLGTSAKAWRDLYLGNTSVIEWSSAASTSDLTLTHSAEVLTFAGGTIALGTATATGGLTGDITGNCTGSSGSCTGESATVATITTLAPDTATTQATQASITTCTNLVTVGALNAGSITSGFTSIDVGAGAITTTGDITGGGILLTGDTSSGDTAALGYTATEGIVVTGQGSTSDVTLKNDADGTVLTIPTGTTNVDVVGDITGATIHADGDTSAGDLATIGYTATEGLILTGQGSTNDITLKNDADATVLGIPTGTTNISVGATDVATKIILANETTIQMSDSAIDADGDHNGITFIGTAGETVAFGDVVYLKNADSQWYLVDADATATGGVVAIAICVSSGTDNNPVTLMTHGIIQANGGFPALTIGAPVYLSLTGTTTNTVTVTAPSATDDVVKIIGHALTADKMLFNPSVDWITIV